MDKEEKKTLKELLEEIWKTWGIKNSKKKARWNISLLQRLEK